MLTELPPEPAQKQKHTTPSTSVDGVSSQGARTNPLVPDAALPPQQDAPTSEGAVAGTAPGEVGEAGQDARARHSNVDASKALATTVPQGAPGHGPMAVVACQVAIERLLRASDPPLPFLVQPATRRRGRKSKPPYYDAKYESVLKTKGVFLTPSRPGIAKEGRDLREHLLENSQPLPSDTLFTDDFFSRDLRNATR